jgi:copper transport protein
MVRPARVARASARWVVGLLAALVLTTWCAPSASAHTKLESSAPADGSTSDVPVDEVVLRFTLPVTALGDGMVVEGPAGTVTADVAAAEGGLVLVATPAEPLPAGAYSVTWTAAAQDGHPLEGSLDFTVAGTDQEPDKDPDGEADGGTDHDMGDMDHDMGDDTGHDTGHDPAAMDSPAADAAAAVARVGSAVALWGGLVAAGALVFAGLVLRGPDRDDVPVVLGPVRRTGLLILAGLAIHVAAGSVHMAHGDVAAAFSPASIADSLTGTTRWALGLQAVGATALVAGTGRTLPASWFAVLGSVLVGAGHVLGGHSNTAEPRWLVLTADVAHLAAAATWVGGVVAMAILLRRRRRDGRALDAALIGARFSVVAAVAVAVVGAAGVVLAVEILDRPAQLWESPWGLLLLAKIAVVAVVGAIGTYNHFRVVPKLAARRSRVRSARKANNVLRRSAGRETGLMAVIVLLTAWLVAASLES